MSRAVEAFLHFRNLLDRYEVDEYLAVATSAMREAVNRDVLISRIYRETGIELVAIGAAEEARLVREFSPYKYGADPVGFTPEEFAKFLKDDVALWAEAVKVAGVTLER